MIQLLGKPFEQIDSVTSDPIEKIIIKQMYESSVYYSYSFLDEISFELKLRKNIIVSARAMDKSSVEFEIFANARCNPKYWNLTNVGGFQLKPDVRPSDAIQDIYNNGSLYAFECATAKVIIFYHAVLNSIGEELFNQYFQNLYLYSWHFDTVYFNNPDVNPETSWWRGENAVVLEDDTYFGHGLGIMTKEKVIQALNKMRKPNSNQSAYLMDRVTRPNFNHLARLSMLHQRVTPYKIQHVVICHNESSISFNHYLSYLNKLYSFR